MLLKAGTTSFSSKRGYPGARREEGLCCQSNVDNVMRAEGSTGMNDGQNFPDIGGF